MSFVWPVFATASFCLDVVLTFRQKIKHTTRPGTEIVTCPARCSRRLALEKKVWDVFYEAWFVGCVLSGGLSFTPWSKYMAQSPKGRLIQGLYKPIHGSCAIYFYPAVSTSLLIHFEIALTYIDRSFGFTELCIYIIYIYINSWSITVPRKANLDFNHPGTVHYTQTKSTSSEKTNGWNPNMEVWFRFDFPFQTGD